MVLKIAVPLDKQLCLYHYNPCTAPKFAIYLIEGSDGEVTYRIKEIVSNPWCGVKCEVFEDSQVNCTCDLERQKSMRHISEHYAILDAIGGCDYLLADQYCDNISYALGKGGITVFKFPPIVNKTDNAIKNFLISSSLVSNVKLIRSVS